MSCTIPGHNSRNTLVVYTRISTCANHLGRGILRFGDTLTILGQYVDRHMHKEVHGFIFILSQDGQNMSEFQDTLTSGLVCFCNKCSYDNYLYNVNLKNGMVSLDMCELSGLIGKLSRLVTSH